MEAVSFLGSRLNGAWRYFGYDIHIGYGYDTMLKLFDKFIADYNVSVERISKAEMYGMAQTPVGEDGSFKGQSLSELEELKEECGALSIGCSARDINNTPVFITLVNQTSIVSIQVPDPLCSDDVKKYLDGIADYLQKTLSDI
ncbi:MAG: hypothetical protein J5508_04880 [Bacteroidales bacterium]|nr:hypothetical protein [Bacteroidales bacterium]